MKRVQPTVVHSQQQSTVRRVSMNLGEKIE